MAKLYDSSDNLLSKTVQVIPEQRPIKIENVLLNGQLDIQIIGDAQQVYRLKFYVTYDDMITLQTAAAQGTTIKLEHEGSTESYNISGIPGFRLASRGISANRYYEGNMTIAVIS
jgi:hypothetical protein